MLRTNETDSRIGYLLGDLSAHEQKEVEERLFRDDQYFQELVRLEEDLIRESNKVALDTASSACVNEVGLRTIERLPAIEIARWVVESNEIDSLTRSEGGRTSQTDLSSIIEARLHEVEEKLREIESEQEFANDWKKRELAAALMEEEWLGLRLIVELRRQTTRSASGLSDQLNVDVDSIVSILIKLVQFGGLEEREGLFSISGLGASVIEALEAEARVTF
ncbi:MAG: hypothetical protein DMF61_14830 [Blastocatellia bacterium AA13]|nr:MAG: hypothetical protein DMF61_14830 [Blastocatellia bacterium AA13]